MGSILLFCISEEAKPCLPKIVHDYTDDPSLMPAYFLVESINCPKDANGFRTEIQEGESFESDFIDSSLEQCQIWAKESWPKVNFIEDFCIAVLDKRSSQDGTLLMSYYCRQPTPNKDVLELWGPLPPHADTWYNFRIDPRFAQSFADTLDAYLPETTHPVYFGVPGKFTDWNGVFDMAKAMKYMDAEAEQDDLYKELYPDEVL